MIINIIAGIITNLYLWFIEPLKTFMGGLVTAQKANLGILIPLAK